MNSKPHRESYHSPKLVTIAEIRSQLNAREREVRKLQLRKAKLIDSAKMIERDIYEITGKPVKGLRRPRNDSNLGDALAQLLLGREMTVPTIMQAVQDAGYQTTAANFRTIVNQRLINDSRFKRVRRGVYTVK